MRKIAYIYIILTIINLSVFVYYLNNNNYNESKYLDGGDGLIIEEIIYNNKKHFNYLDDDFNTLINITKINFEGEVITVAPFENN